MKTVYSDPKLWERAKAEARKRMGGHSARAMQLAGRLYRAAGGRYIGKRTPAQKSLERWTDQDWTTKSGKPSRKTGERYLPRRVIEKLTPAEYGATTRAKRAGTAAGQQFVKQPKRIAAKVAALKENPTVRKPTPAQLAARARFAEMARSGAFKRKAKAAKKAAPKKTTRKTTSAATYSVVSRDGVIEAKGLTLAAARKFIADKAKRTKRFAGYWSAVKINPATGEKKSRTKLNPMAAPVQVSSDSMFKYSVEAKRSLGSAGAVFETVAAFHTKAQAQDYAKAVLGSHPSATLRIKTYSRQK